MTKHFLLLTSKKLIILLILELSFSTTNLHQNEAPKHLFKNLASDWYSKAREDRPMFERTMTDNIGEQDSMDKESSLNLEPSGEESEFENQLDSAIATMVQEALYSEMVATQSSENRIGSNLHYKPPNEKHLPVTDSSISDQENIFNLKNKETTEESDNKTNTFLFNGTKEEIGNTLISNSSFVNSYQDGQGITNEVNFKTTSHSNTPASVPILSSISIDNNLSQKIRGITNKLDLNTYSTSTSPKFQSTKSSKLSYGGISHDNLKTNGHNSVQTTNQKRSEITSGNLEYSKIHLVTEQPDEKSNSTSMKDEETPATDLITLGSISPKSPERKVRDGPNHKTLRIARKEPNVEVLQTKNTKIETKAWKTTVKVGNPDIIPRRPKTDLKSKDLIAAPMTELIETTTRKPTEAPEKACKQKHVSCEECKATSPQCHYNFTGKFCFHSSIVHENEVYECGTRYVPSDGYDTVMAVAAVLIIASVALSVFLISAVLQKKRSAALPEEELEAMRLQVQFVRDRRTNK